MPRINWKNCIKELLERGIQEQLSENKPENITISQLKENIDRLIDETDLTQALESVITTNTLPARTEHQLIPLEIQIINRSYGFSYEIINGSTLPNPQELLENTFVIKLSKDFYLEVNRFEIPDELPVPPEWLN